MSTTAFDGATQHQSSRPFFAFWSPERAVLTRLLDQHPRCLTIEELARDLGHGFRESTVKRAVDNLAAAHFVHREGAALTPAPAVVSFDKEPIATNF